jgi:hypothetical protein
MGELGKRLLANKGTAGISNGRLSRTHGFEVGNGLGLFCDTPAYVAR